MTSSTPGPVTDQGYAVAVEDRQTRELIALADVLAEHYPHADGAGVRAIGVTGWELVASLAKLDRLPSVTEIGRLAVMADARQATNAMSDAELFSGLGGVA